MNKKQRESQIRKELRETNHCTRGMVTASLHSKGIYHVRWRNYLPEDLNPPEEFSLSDTVKILLEVEAIPISNEALLTEMAIVKAFQKEGYYPTERAQIGSWIDLLFANNDPAREERVIRIL